MIKTFYNVTSKYNGETVTCDRHYGYCFIYDNIPFGIAKIRHEVSRNNIVKDNDWTLTHLETGFKISHSFKTLKTAIDFVKHDLCNPYSFYGKNFDRVIREAKEISKVYSLNEALIEYLRYETILDDLR